MQYINQATIRGFVGSVRRTPMGNKTIVRFTVCTNYSYRNKADEKISENTWHNCQAVQYHSSGIISDIDVLDKGLPVEVVGRIRNVRYTNAEGKEVNQTEILASSVKHV